MAERMNPGRLQERQLPANWSAESPHQRAQLFEAISRTFVASWNNGLDADMATFLRQFSRTIDWYDHAFYLRQKGLEDLAAFRTGWLTAIKDFRCEIKSIRPVADGAAIQCVYHGAMVGPLLGRKPSGKTFAANVLVLLGINGEGKIQTVDEYYSATLDEAGDTET